MVALGSLQTSDLVAWRPSATAVRRGVEGVLVLLVAAQAARLAWALVTPLGPIGDPVGPRAQATLAPPADMSVLERFAPSAVPAIAPVPVAAAAPTPAPLVTGYRLQGVRGSIAGDGGSAIIAGPDGRQTSYQRGDKVGPGITLAAIGRDAVTLSSAAGSVRLELGAEAPPALPPSASGLNFGSPPVPLPVPPPVAPPIPASPGLPPASAPARP